MWTLISLKPILFVVEPCPSVVLSLGSGLKPLIMMSSLEVPSLHLVPYHSTSVSLIGTYHLSLLIIFLQPKEAEGNCSLVSPGTLAPLFLSQVVTSRSQGLCLACLCLRLPVPCHASPLHLYWCLSVPGEQRASPDWASLL